MPRPREGGRWVGDSRGPCEVLPDHSVQNRVGGSGWDVGSYGALPDAALVRGGRVGLYSVWWPHARGGHHRGSVVIRRILTHLGLPTEASAPRPPPSDLFDWS